MKRLNLADFKTQKNIPSSTQQTDQLLGQVLGACHDIKEKFDKANSGVSNEVQF